jgi:uncharacterized protein YkwD
MNRHVITIGTLLFASGLFSMPVSTSASMKYRQQAPRVMQIAQSTAINTSSIEQSIFKQINQYRASKGLSQLTRNPQIDNQARIHSQNMASGKVPFGHQDFNTRVKSAGIAYSGAAENVAYNQGYRDPAIQAVQGWLKSQGHKRNIEGNYSQTGIGVATNSKGEVYFTEIFINSK